MKYDSNYIKKNHDEVVRSCFANALNLTTEAEILIKNKKYARAQFLCITALEEYAKASILLKKKFDSTTLKALISHELKAPHIVKIISGLLSEELGIKMDNKAIKTTQDRIPAMREDTLYVRLKSTKNNQILPNDEYWKKRALNYFGYLRLLHRRIQKIKKRRQTKKT